MFRYTNGHFRLNPPRTVEHKGYIVNFADLSREQWDELGYNEAIPYTREPYTNYETEWVKGDDLIYREVVVSETPDVNARVAAQSNELRSKRDALLTETDWTQLTDTTMDDEVTVLWQGYRQALRDVPQQQGFPLNVDWPEAPIME